MQRKTKIKTKEITKTVLELLAVGSGVTLLALLGQGRGSDRYARALAAYSATRIRETIKRLRMQGYIQYDGRDETSPILLTEKGTVRTFQFRFFRIRKQQKKWDYLWRMVIFDIPERQKRLRELFRHELQDAGFFSIQKSIFVTPYACEKEMEELCRLWMIERYALVFITASLGNIERKARRYFFGDRS